MKHSMNSANRQTHCRIIGSVFVVICILIMLGTAAITRHEQQQASSITVLRVGVPVAVTHGGYFIVR